MCINPKSAKAQADTLDLFVLKDCQRCLQAQQYMASHSIPFQLFRYESKPDFMRLAKVLNQAGFEKGRKLSFPVVVCKGYIRYNIVNLEGFLDSLTAKSESAH